MSLMIDSKSKEQAAILQLQRKNIQGLEYLVQTYQVEAIRVAYMVTRDLQQAEEVVQDSFLQVYERINSFDENRKFKPWFRRIVLNNAIKATKKSAKTFVFSTLNGNKDLSPEAILLSVLPAPEEQISAKMLEEQIWNALEKLPPKQRAVVVAYYYLDMKEKEISTILNVPKGTIKWRLYSARKRLKLLLTIR